MQDGRLLVTGFLTNTQKTVRRRIPTSVFLPCRETLKLVCEDNAEDVDASRTYSSPEGESIGNKTSISFHLG